MGSVSLRRQQKWVRCDGALRRREQERKTHREGDRKTDGKKERAGEREMLHVAGAESWTQQEVSIHDLTFSEGQGAIQAFKQCEQNKMEQFGYLHHSDMTLRRKER